MSNNYYKYGIPPKELKEVRKYIIQDIRDNNECPYKIPKNAIENMTLRMYFDMIKECMLCFINEDGIVVNQNNEIWSKYNARDVRSQDSIEVAENWMDGRGLFHEHFNGSLYFNEHHWGDWENINTHEQNKWYHEDRLDDPDWFKECVTLIGHAGHPTEMLTCGHFNPVPLDDNWNKWIICFGMFNRFDYYVLKAYLQMKKKGLPVFIDNPKVYLTPKQRANI